MSDSSGEGVFEGFRNPFSLGPTHSLSCFHLPFHRLVTTRSVDAGHNGMVFGDRSRGRHRTYEGRVLRASVSGKDSPSKYPVPDNVRFLFVLNGRLIKNL